MDKKIVLASAALALLEVLFLPLPFEQIVLVAITTAALPAVSLDLYAEYLEERKRLELEERLPEALLQMASRPKGTAIEEVLEELARQPGETGKQFKSITRRIRSGISAPNALRRHPTNSFLFKRVLEMIANAYESGADASKTFKQVAEDVLELQFISREAASAATLQKYSLLAASTLFVPFILGFLYNLVESLDFAGIQGIFSTSTMERRALVEAISLGNQAYLALFALITSSFVSFNENKPRKAVAYAAICLPLSLIAYYVARSASIL
ncbi:hypothetical protein COX85_03885 [Candidatus Micrarchaeota archaeon CG_4_10_14_0_2_um_filter_55_9]|nr:MAG: hypothetical protein AUJ15_01580 [Candidatus Micrarchaeota archaeon CG1_02_55_41]PIO03747.1 MAG: hypothetical protein COT57_00350 [Candidatus Micrarchaeota archaeon CG09_land_8_20_14_0_10_55_25]PIZ91438.1 MAG: hypothetical protein COX85_03885 [Candidatus Micrarchaeota archaeon CG_4_10_14_0_2_um_filter_55_9]PJD01413.1 MAG: hypothetical protein COU38_01120 [Candidatus Micrarchaeota archaeon CG10_big_fil_rev_8_21_14_0_10_54_18]